MSWVAVASLVVTDISKRAQSGDWTGVQGGIFGSGQNKQQAQAQALQDQANKNPAGIFGKPIDFQAPEYTPLYVSDPGYRGIVADTIAGDQANLPAASKLAADINKAITASAKDRATSWDAGFIGSLNALGHNADAALQGQLPYDDALSIVSNRGRLAADIGYAGGAGPQTAADLGRTRTSLMTEVGPNLLSGLASIMNVVDPISRHTTPENFTLSPAQAVTSAIGENQFAASYGLQAGLEQATLAALPNPQAQGQFNLSALLAGLNGGVNNNSGAATAQVLGQALQIYAATSNRPSYTPTTSSSLNPASGSSIYGNTNYGSGVSYSPTTRYNLDRYPTN